MKNRILIAVYFFLLLGLPSSLFAFTATEFATEAQKFYQQGDYEKAIGKWQELKLMGWGGAYVDYNIGNSFFRLGKLGLAKGYWLKAQTELPRNPYLAHNLQHLDKIMNKGNHEEKNLINWVMGHAYRLKLNYSEALYFQAFCSFLIVLSFCLFRWKKVRVFKIFLLSSSFIYAMSLLLFITTAITHMISRAVVLEEVWVREEPVEQSNRLAQLKEGQVIRLKSIEGEVVWVKTAGGVEGWVSKAAVMPL